MEGEVLMGKLFTARCENGELTLTDSQDEVNMFCVPVDESAIAHFYEWLDDIKESKQ